MKSLALPLLFLVTTAACGELESPCDYEDSGVCIHVESAREWSSEADMRPRMQHLIAASLEYWGGDWDRLHGWRIAVQDPTIGEYSIGRTYVADREIVVSSVWAKECLEQLPIPHEIGHALIYDPEHTDPRWASFAPLADAMTEYARALGDEECVVYPLMW